MEVFIKLLWNLSKSNYPINPTVSLTSSTNKIPMPGASISISFLIASIISFAKSSLVIIKTISFSGSIGKLNKRFCSWTPLPLALIIVAPLAPALVADSTTSSPFSLSTITRLLYTYFSLPFHINFHFLIMISIKTIKSNSKDNTVIWFI